MSTFSNVTAQDLFDRCQLAEQQKSQRTLIIKKRILKQTHDIKLAESLSPITKNLENINETTKNLGKRIKKSDVEDGNTETPPIGNITVAQSLLDTLSFMKRSRIFFEIESKRKWWSSLEWCIY